MTELDVNVAPHLETVTADDAFRLETEIKQLRHLTNTSFWQMIDRLAKARAIKIWEQLGHGSWAAWLAQESLDLHAVTVDRYLRAYKAIGSRLDPQVALPLFSISKSKVLIVAAKLTPENSGELIEKARTLSYSDLRQEVAELATVDELVEDDPPSLPRPVFKWCPRHKQWRLVRGELSHICQH